MNSQKSFNRVTLIAWSTIVVILVMWSISLHTAEADSLFKSAVHYDAGDGPSSVAIGDLNGDGDPDLTVANEGSDNISVLLGNGDGSFQSALNYGTGDGSSSVAIGDLNGDANPDLAVANKGSNNVSVLLGNGDGSFQSAMDYDAGDGPSSVAIGDFNGDDNPDLAVANAYSANVSVLLGNGDGSFQSAVNYGIGGWPSSVAIGDFNGDDNPDLAVATHDGIDGNVGVLLGNGDGSFQSAVNYNTGAGPPYSVAIGDLNGDDDLDLAFTGVGEVSVLLGNGDGSFQSAVYYPAGNGPMSVAIGDLNGDSDLDLAVANANFGAPGTGYVSVLLGNGDGSFQSAEAYGAGDLSLSVAIGDLNGDGALDLAVANSDSDNVSILINTGGYQNQPPEAICQDVTSSTEPGVCSADASIDDGSFDPDGDPVTLEQTPPGPYDLGDTDVTLTVTDDNGLFDTCEAIVTIEDQEDPVISSVTASPNELWPPNNKMVPVVLAVDATDNCDSEPFCHIISVTSNEPSLSRNFAPDWVITGDLTVNLRAERYGTGSGRIYTITVECVDSSGNSSTDTATVTVPHDKGKKKNQNNKKKK